MNFPNLPTDNLYKFLALSGVLTIAFSIILPAIAIHNLRLELIKTNGELKVLEAEVGFIEKDTAKENLSPEERTQVESRIREARIKLIQIKNKDEVERFLHRQTIIWLIGAVFGVIVGFTMARKGFSLWYEKVQKFRMQY